MDSLRRLEEIFAHFPGIGPRQAKRFVYYLQTKSPAFIKEFTQLVDEIKRATAECSDCHRFFVQKSGVLAGTAGAAVPSLCPTCTDSSRDRSKLMIVARDTDFETIERSGAYKGLYFVLGGTVPLLDKEPEKRIRLQALLERVSGSNDARSATAATAPALAEVILSLNTTPDGDHTATIVKDALQRVSQTRITVLGRGLSTGAELEYADGETIRNALEHRR